ncbi:MAG: hypothetical protein J6T24_03100 [Clostridia bacterium]|nr:hypothetical protein [Clostridia bacterium]
MQFLTLLLFDIILGFVPQAMGCAVCLFAFANQPLRSKNFLFTSLIFSGIAIVVRIIFNYGLIDFGFHTVLIFLIFAVVAITYNKFPVLQSTVGIMLSGVLIVVAELITGVVISLFLGMETFDAIMDNTATIEGQITRALCGIPMNILFVAIALLAYFLVKRKRAKKS